MSGFITRLLPNAFTGGSGRLPSALPTARAASDLTAPSALATARALSLPLPSTGSGICGVGGGGTPSPLPSRLPHTDTERLRRAVASASRTCDMLMGVLGAPPIRLPSDPRRRWPLGVLAASSLSGARGRRRMGTSSNANPHLVLYSLIRSSSTAEGCRGMPTMNASSSSCADVGRLAGSASRHFLRNPLHATDHFEGSSREGGGLVAMDIMARARGRSWYGGLPCASCMRVMPRDQMSVDVVYCFPSKISGDMNSGVPTIVIARLPMPSCPDTPKSAIFVVPRYPIRMFCAFMSRCTIALL
mmetsp:Transcript_1795/g.4073  ORF Transcript_1795/g.4073 Transcript_1795/m.4073 type:complete len:302 (-) Transcript_1795:631-1536(-)